MDGLQPELCERAIPLDVNMRRFTALVTEEEEPIWPEKENGRHNVLACKSIRERRSA